MTQKLALYFTEQDNSSPRILDAEFQPTHGTQAGWLVGRNPDCNIVFSPTRHGDYSMVSKHHAMIRATPSLDTTEGGNKIYRWEVLDLLSSNGTWIKSGQDSLYRCAPKVPYQITERTVLRFGPRATSLLCSFDIDETHNTDDDEDGPPTGGSAKAAAAAAHSSPWYVPAILEPVWGWFTAKNTPEQFVFLLAIGGLAALILYVWRL